MGNGGRCSEDHKSEVSLGESLQVSDKTQCRNLPKKPTQVRFTKDGQTILASDKFGDVFRYAQVSKIFTPMIYEF